MQVIIFKSNIWLGLMSQKNGLLMPQNVTLGYTGYISLPEELSRHLEAECSTAEEGKNVPTMQSSHSN